MDGPSWRPFVSNPIWKNRKKLKLVVWSDASNICQLSWTSFASPFCQSIWPHHLRNVETGRPNDTSGIPWQSQNMHYPSEWQLANHNSCFGSIEYGYSTIFCHGDSCNEKDCRIPSCCLWNKAEEIYVFLHVKDERAYGGEGYAYDGLDFRFQATNPTIPGNPTRSVHGIAPYGSSVSRFCLYSSSVGGQMACPPAFGLCPSLVRWTTYPTRLNLTICSTIYSNCVRRVNWISSETWRQLAQPTSFKAFSTIVNIANLSPSLNFE